MIHSVRMYVRTRRLSQKLTMIQQEKKKIVEVFSRYGRHLFIDHPRLRLRNRKTFFTCGHIEGALSRDGNNKSVWKVDVVYKCFVRVPVSRESTHYLISTIEEDENLREYYERNTCLKINECLG